MRNGSSKKDHFTLAIEYLGKSYEIASMSISSESREMFYVFPGNSRTIARFYEEGSSHLQRTFDHISFHESGTVHIRHKDVKGNPEKIMVKENGPSVFDIRADEYLPILIHSFSFGPRGLNEVLVPQTNKRGNVASWQCSDTRSFSVIPVLFGRNVSPRKLLSNDVFGPIADHSQQQPILAEPFRLHDEKPDFAKNGFQDTSLLLVFSKGIQRMDESTKSIIEEIQATQNTTASFGVLPPPHVLRNLVFHVERGTGLNK